MEEMYLSAMIRDALPGNEEFSLTINSEGLVVSTSTFSISIDKDLIISAYSDDEISYENIKAINKIANLFKSQTTTLGKFMMDCGKDEK